MLGPSNDGLSASVMMEAGNIRPVKLMLASTASVFAVLTAGGGFAGPAEETCTKTAQSVSSAWLDPSRARTTRLRAVGTESVT